MKNSSLKLTGFFSILTGIAYFLVSLLYGMNPAEKLAHEPSKYWNFLSNNPSAVMYQNLENIALGLASLFLVAVVIGYYRLLEKENKEWVSIGSLFAIISGIVVAINAFTIIGSTSHLINLYQSGEEVVKKVIEMMPEVVVDQKGFLGFGLTGLWMLITNVVGMKAKAISKVLGCIGLLGGLFYIIVVAGFVLGKATLVAIGAGLGCGLIFPIWFIWSGINFIRRVDSTR